MDKKYVKDYIARRVANELKDGFVVNLGVGLPTLCTKYLPEGVKICMTLSWALSARAPLRCPATPTMIP